jgi:hypothetical protein
MEGGCGVGETPCDTGGGQDWFAKWSKS